MGSTYRDKDSRALALDLRRRPLFKKSSEQDPFDVDRIPHNVDVLEYVLSANAAAGGFDIDEGEEGAIFLQKVLAQIIAPGQRLHAFLNNEAAHPPLRDALVDLANGLLPVQRSVEANADTHVDNTNTAKAPADDATRPNAEAPVSVPGDREARSDHLRSLFGAWFDPSLSCRNGLVADNATLASGVLGSNANPLHLGAGEGTTAVTFYQNKYTAKNDFKHALSLSVIADSYRRIKDYPSTAEDSGTESRQAKHFVQSVCNKATMELKATQAASVALGHQSSFHSKKLAFTNGWAMVSFKKILSQRSNTTADEAEDELDDALELEENVDVDAQEDAGIETIIDEDSDTASNAPEAAEPDLDEDGAEKDNDDEDVEESEETQTRRIEAESWLLASAESDAGNGRVYQIGRGKVTTSTAAQEYGWRSRRLGSVQCQTQSKVEYSSRCLRFEL